MNEPLPPPAVRTLLTSILVGDNGVVRFSAHARTRMDERGVDEVDVFEVLSRGSVPTKNHAQLENGSWRYRVCRRDLTVVISFDETTTTIIVTVMV
jgi:hypothetical protein